MRSGSCFVKRLGAKPEGILKPPIEVPLRCISQLKGVINVAVETTLEAWNNDVTSRVLQFKGQREGSNMTVRYELTLPCAESEFRLFLDAAKRYCGLGADRFVEIAPDLSITYVRGKDGKPGYFTAETVQRVGARVVKITYEPAENAEGNEFTYGPATDAVNEYYQMPENGSLFSP